MSLTTFSRLAALVLVFSGCASNPPEGLRTKGDQRSFNVAAPPDVAYHRIVDGTRTCYARREVAADWFPDTSTGRVSMSVKTRFSINALFNIEIAPRQGGGARVTVSYLHGATTFADAAEAWAQENYSICPFG